MTPIELALGTGPRSGVFGGLCLIVGLGCGLLPALRATPRRRPARARPVARVAHRRDPGLSPARSLIALQVALSLVLVVGAGLFMRTLLNLRSEALGFRPDHLLLFGWTRHERIRGPALLDFYERVLERLAAIPGVQSASFSRSGLLRAARRATASMLGAPPGRRSGRSHPLRRAGDFRRWGFRSSRAATWRRGSREFAARRHGQPDARAADARGGVPSPASRSA